MTQVIPSPAWQELRGLVADERAEPVSSPVGVPDAEAPGVRASAPDGEGAAGVVTYLPPDGRY
ncbi:hypothetical protein ABT120_49115 [Nonomuraea angiospora]|uniref:hypothetical protein n=1 Tax=Nonomuraea angiospora TaxID=46172 RepID=UPI0033177ED6